ncbi:hypothetical protein P3L10_009065 [Capsicum annuum]
MPGRRIALRPIRRVPRRHYDFLLLQNNFDRLFYDLREDRRYLERELRRIAHFLRAILEHLGMDDNDYITPHPPHNLVYCFFCLCC